MSTDMTLCHRHINQLLPLVVLGSLLSCAPRVSARLGDLCAGSVVQQELTLVLDSIPSVARSFRALTGKRYHVTLWLMPALTPRDCGSAAGEANITADLPDELKAGISTRAIPTWLLVGTDVVVDFNPGIVDRDLRLRLPLDGRTGHWTLTQPGGELASGRVLHL